MQTALGMSLCMKGTITTRQRCPICGAKFVHIEVRAALLCPDHPELRASKFIVRFPPAVFKNFNSYEQAARFLTGLRYKTDEGTFDQRDYQKDKPLSFTTLTEQYLNRKRSLKSFKEVRNYIGKAQDYFQQKNVKEINGADIEDFLFSLQGISEKTRHNYKSSLHDFWQFLLRRNVINLAQVPTFPRIEYELAYRNFTSWEVQSQILDKICELADPINPKIGFGVEMLATYTALRPDDLRRVTEADFDLENSVLVIRRPTKRKNHMKTIRLIPEHVERVRQFRAQFPGVGEAPFFRHSGNLQGCAAGSPFGPAYFRKYWHRACQTLGIKGLDLYGGTRHTTTTELSRNYSTDMARKASGHETNKAFDRYCQVQDSTALEAARIVAGRRERVVELKKAKK
ncbi:Integrase [Desulfuromonas thiophila]|uniref:Integrase n=2 Tax=Desulfuromonas thiophila TaxID=57664 RepID=A0A1G7B467_9BACT|nr:Integrase [Desulfuromonas thiophila]